MPTLTYAAPGDPPLKSAVIRFIERLSGQTVLQSLYCSATQDTSASAGCDVWTAALDRLGIRLAIEGSGSTRPQRCRPGDLSSLLQIIRMASSMGSPCATSCRGPGRTSGYSSTAFSAAMSGLMITSCRSISARRRRRGERICDRCAQGCRRKKLSAQARSAYWSCT